VLAFISRKVFIDTLGTEIVGLSATMRNILGFLNLAELGVYTAVATSLYKPLFDQDEKKVNEIISLFGYLYRIIGFIILGLGIIVSIFLPWMFAKTDLDFLILYAAFYTFLAVTLVSYFNNYKQVLLAADQRTYVTTRLSNWINLCKVGLQIIYLLGRHTHLITLYRRRYFDLHIFDGFDDLFGFIFVYGIYDSVNHFCVTTTNTLSLHFFQCLAGNASFNKF